MHYAANNAAGKNKEKNLKQKSIQLRRNDWVIVHGVSLERGKESALDRIYETSRF